MGREMATAIEIRRVQYREVLGALLRKGCFTVREAVASCEESSRGLVGRGLVSRVVRELVMEDWLEVLGGEAPRRYGWRGEVGRADLEAWVDRRFPERLRGRQVQAAPEGDRPRERLRSKGVSQLRTAELLAILIRTGRPGHSAMESGEAIANRYAETLWELRDRTQAELKAISSAISEPAYCQIMAGIELGRRIAEAMESRPRVSKLDSSHEAIAYCRREFARLIEDAKQEEVHVITLDTKLKPIGRYLVSAGTIDASLIHPREVLRYAVRDNAMGMLMVHNHPSGDPTPSGEDIAVTRKIEQAAKVMGILMADHIVVARHGCVSIRTVMQEA